VGRRHPTELELLTAGEDRRRDGVDLGGGEDEDEMGRRLLDDLEQRVEGLAGQSVHLVEDDDLVTVPGGAVAEALGELADLLDLGVGRRVDLEDVHVRAGGDLTTGVAFVAGIGRRPAFAVQRLGEDPGGAGLADAADAREEVGLGDPILRQGVAQRGGDRFLSHQTREVLGAGLAGQGLVRQECGK